MNKNITLIGMTVALVAGGVAGYYGASYQYSSILTKAKAAFPTQSTMSAVFGTVKSVSGNTVTIQTQPSMNPFENLPAVRTVTVTSTTKIVKNEQKDPQVFQQEMIAYQKAMQKSASTSGTSTPASVGQPATSPMPFVETVVNIADLKVGDMVSVDAGKDVKTAASFDAVKITVNESIGAPGVGGVTPPIGAGAPLVPLPPAPETTPIVNTPPLKK